MSAHTGHSHESTTSSTAHATPRRRVPLSILDLVSVSEGMSQADAIRASMETVQLADKLGYSRYWFAEHHNTPAVASSATSLLIGQAAQLTSRIRVGSGGIMLPNHAPLVVAEQFGTLIQMHGDRIDLGLGRAPGTDPMTAQMLARTSAEPEAFMQAIEMMQLWSRRDMPAGLRVEAPVAAGTNIPMWVLGSTVNGAMLAAKLGLPFAVASHFAPFQYRQAIDVYRREFDAQAETAQISEPRVMVAANVVVSPTDEQAQFQFQSLREMFTSIIMGQRKYLQAPRDLTADFSPAILDNVDRTLSISAVGSPETAVTQLEEIVAASGADELILTSYHFDPRDRMEALTLLAEAWGLTTG